ncbi:MAG: glycine cleavage system protein H, partial [Steroidobacter sp.]
VYSPVSGEVIAVNESLSGTPELINSSPYGDGWLMKLRLADKAELNKLLDAAAYKAVVDAAH